jgi:hypothetical protein
MGWKVWGSNTGGGKIFRTYPDQPWGPPNLLYNGYQVFTGDKGSRGVTLTTRPHVVPRSWKSGAIPLLPLWAHVACNRVKPYPTIIRSWIKKWLRRCATSRTVPGSMPGGVTGFFSVIFPFDRTVALGSTQPLVKMSTRNIPGGKGGWCVRLTTSPPSHAECHGIWEPKPPGTLWATPGQLQDSFIFSFYCIYLNITWKFFS